MPVYGELTAALASVGLVPRGGFLIGADDQLPNVPGGVGKTLVMVGNAGAAMWQAFAPHRNTGINPLDEWTERVISQIARSFLADAIYPWTKPYPPFQQWAMRAEAVSPSPLGILIHPEHGLWHAYRAALIFPDQLCLPARLDRPSPCDSCTDKPCLSACPVDAFSVHGYDVAACVAHIAEPASIQTCRRDGCRARAACPVGTPYSAEQVRHHMASFYASRSV